MQVSSVLSLSSILPQVRDFICHCVLKVNFENYITSIQEVFFPCLIQYFLLCNVRIFSPKQDQWSGNFSNYVEWNSFFFFFNTIVQKHTAHQLGKGELFSQQTEFFALEDLSLKA